jgi:hypothetical protein
VNRRQAARVKIGDKLFVNDGGIRATVAVWATNGERAFGEDEYGRTWSLLLCDDSCCPGPKPYSGPATTYGALMP